LIRPILIRRDLDNDVIVYHETNAGDCFLAVKRGTLHIELSDWKVRLNGRLTCIYRGVRKTSWRRSVDKMRIN